MKNILVTGGAGFIGSNYVYYMLEKHPDYRIVCIDKLTYAGNLETLRKAMESESFRFVKADITDREAVYKLFEEESFSAVVNFAAESHVDRSIEEPEVFLKTNILGTQVLLDACLAMDAPCTLLFDLKDGVGNFFYDSAVDGQGEDSRDLLSDILTQLQEEGFHLVARISALRDRTYGLNYPACGLPLSSGVLWMDEGGCYWLDPADDKVQVRLVRICAELFELGFSEVVLNNFYFPDSDQIVYPDKENADSILADTARRIRDALEGQGLVSIYLQEDQAPMDPGSGRLYFSTDDVLQLQLLQTATSLWLEDPAAQLVLLTDSRDTRFDGYSLLRNWDE